MGRVFAGKNPAQHGDSNTCFVILSFGPVVGVTRRRKRIIMVSTVQHSLINLSYRAICQQRQRGEISGYAIKSQFINRESYMECDGTQSFISASALLSVFTSVQGSVFLSHR